MEENPYESPAELPLEDEETAPQPGPDLALRVKRITQVVTLVCAVLFFLLNSQVLPPQQPIVMQLLFGGAMLGLIVTIACNYFVRRKKPRATTPRRLKMK